jgi:hypothetical protein
MGTCVHCPKCASENVVFSKKRGAYVCEDCGDVLFPKLEQLCAQNGFQFQAIDLRWGVSGEAALDHRTMRICFDELRRAQDISPRPNFLILLGNRYGWRPLPEEISVAEFQALKRAAAQMATSTDKNPSAILRPDSG